MKKKKDETQGVRCHVKTMMNMEGCEAQRYTTIMLSVMIETEKQKA
jgi:hypothetical protein